LVSAGPGLTAAVLSRQYVAVKSDRIVINILYPVGVPKLWTETIEAHRAAVRDAALDTAAALAAEHGVASVTMSQIAEQTGIGRATLYKYFPDVEAILVAWHQRQIARHLAQLGEIAAQRSTARDRLRAVLEAYALIVHEMPQGTELAALLHQGEHIAAAQRQLREFIGGLIADAAKAGDLRGDIAPGELASYCLHALTAAGSLPSADAVRRLVTLTMAGLRPPAG
jgi:AcrR family transcriptional regulator